jgi:6-phosphogluconolactonase
VADRAAPRILVASDPARETGGVLARAIEEAQRRSGSVRLAMAGGSCVAALVFARPALASLWGSIRLTWADERCVNFGDPRSNRGNAYRSGALDATQPPRLELPLYLDGETPEEACSRVAAVLEARFQSALDVLLLGMGPDGHIASLFPGHSVLEAQGMVTAVLDSPKPPSCRMTLTSSMLVTATASVLLATGEGKRPALQRLAAGDRSLPATSLRGLTVVTDLTL